MVNSRVSIIILNWNGLRDTIECIESLKKITYPNYDVIVIDNASKNNEGQILKEKFGGYIHLIQNDKNYGFAEGNNIGIRYALKNGADYILCLNNDATVEQNFLDKMVNAALIKKADMVAARMLNYFNKNKIDNLGIQITWSGLSFNILEENCKYLFCPCGGAALYSAKFLKDTARDNNYFDPDFFIYNEDVDLGFRARLLDYKCALANKAIVYHKGGVSAKHLSNFHVYYNQRNILFTLLKNLPTSLFLIYSLWIIALQIGLFLIALKRRKIIPFIMANVYIILHLKQILQKRTQIQTNKKITNSQFAKLLTPKPFLWNYFQRALTIG